jgi:hypothetical protein
MPEEMKNGQSNRPSSRQDYVVINVGPGSPYERTQESDGTYFYCLKPGEEPVTIQTTGTPSQKPGF